MQRLDPAFTHLRNYSDAPSARRMGERGENFAALVQSIFEDEKAKEVYLSWLQELRPEEIDDVGVLHGAVGEPLFMLRENGRDFPAQVLSDGTLRFAALAAALFQPDMPDLLMMEEVENGIHASRLRFLLAFPLMVEDLLRGFVAGPWSGEIDFSTLEKLSAEYVSDELLARHGDAVWRVRLRESWLYLLVLLEFQSQDEPRMALRILAYTSLLYQELVRTARWARASGCQPCFRWCCTTASRRGGRLGTWAT